MLTSDNMNVKLEDGHLKRPIEINQLEGVANGLLNNFVVNLTRSIARFKDSMVYINYRLHQLVDWSLDFEVGAKVLCSLQWKEVHDRMHQWDQFFKENK